MLLALFPRSENFSASVLIAGITAFVFAVATVKSLVAHHLKK